MKHSYRWKGLETTKPKDFILQTDEYYLLHSVHGPFLLKTTNYSDQNFFTDNPVRALKLTMEEIQRNMARQTILWLPSANNTQNPIKWVDSTLNLVSIHKIKIQSCWGRRQIRLVCMRSYILYIFFFSLALQPQFGPWPTSMKLSVSLWFSRS
jgi:hypothetical protein